MSWHVSVFSSFLRLDNIPLYVHTTFCLFIPPLRDTGCSHLLVIVNNAAMNMNVQKSFQVPAFNSFGYILRKGHMIIQLLIF